MTQLESLNGRFVSGSFDEDVAYEFLYRRAVEVNLPPVLFIIHLDERGEKSFRFRCKHVNYIANSHVQREQEYLFIPYSVFTVLETDWKVRWADAHNRLMTGAFVDGCEQIHGLSESLTGFMSVRGLSASRTALGCALRRMVGMRWYFAGLQPRQKLRCWL